MRVTKKYIDGIRKGSLALMVVALAASPVVASAATQSTGTTINATIGSTINITSGPSVAIAITPTSGGVVSSASDTVTVSTNNSAGYALTLENGDANRNLVSGANTIAAHTGTHAAPTAFSGNAWGYAVAGGAFDASYAALTNAASSTTKWAGVPASGSAATLKTTASAATSDATTVWYAVRANTSVPSGAYSDTVTYTATTN